MTKKTFFLFFLVGFIFMLPGTGIASYEIDITDLSSGTLDDTVIYNDELKLGSRSDTNTINQTTAWSDISSAGTYNNVWFVAPLPYSSGANQNKVMVVTEGDGGGLNMKYRLLPEEPTLAQIDDEVTYPWSADILLTDSTGYGLVGVFDYDETPIGQDINGRIWMFWGSGGGLIYILMMMV